MQSAAGSVRQLTIDRPTQLIAANGNAGFLLSFDPQLTYSAANSPSADQNLESIIILSTVQGFFNLTPGLGCKPGDVIFFSPRASLCSATLYFEP
jgi:hypothetical protein